MTSRKNNKPDSNIEGAHIQAKATIIGAIIGALIGGFITIAVSNYTAKTTLGNSALNNAYTDLQEKYDNLEAKYDDLTQKYNELNEQYESLISESYWEEYSVTVGERITDKKCDCSFIVEDVYTSLEQIIISIINYDESNEGIAEIAEIRLGEQIPLDKNNKYLLRLQSIEDSDHCTIIVKDN